MGNQPPKSAKILKRTPLAERTPEEQARALLDQLRTEMSWPITFARTIASLAPADREILDRVLRAVREARRQVQEAQATEDAWPT